MLIDSYAYTNRMHFVHPVEKLLFSFITMFLCFFFDIYTNIIVIFLMFLITVLRAKIPAKVYVKFMLVPSSFLLLSLLTIMINPINDNSNIVIFAFKFFNLKLGITHYGIMMALNLFFRVLAIVSCLYFLAFTTPIIDIINVLKKLRIPSLFLELFQLIYRFIFVLLKEAEEIYISQESRLGYKNIKNSFKSLGFLVYSLLLKSYNYSQNLYIALESRLYTGEIKVISREYKFSIINIIFFLVIDASLVVTSTFIRRWL
ncbi:cobalt ECF transporter T component CbiQ [Caldanaerobacter sp.]|uniref:cobalt ECF transporter T component CbiQ n=1 Tax=Caldanaerobacter sp. TaxID=2930036 RepID=UPI003C75DDCE